MSDVTAKTKQKRITSTLAINMSMLAKLMGVQRKELYEDRKHPQLDYERLYVLCEQIRSIAPWGLEAGARCVFRDQYSLWHMIERGDDIDDICNMAVYVAEKWSNRSD